MKDIRIGFLGAGKIANSLADAFSRVPGVIKYAVAARDLNKAKEFKEKHNFEVAYGNYEEMLQDDNVDAVYINTIHSLHYEHALLALKYNKPVLCEKSLTTSLKDTKDLYEKFKEKDVLLVEALWTSFMPYNDILYEEIFNKKTIGNLIKIKTSFNLNNYNIPRIKERSMGGGAVLDLGIYSISFIIRLLGKDFLSCKIIKSKRKNNVDIKDVIVFNYSKCKKAIAECKVKSLIQKNEAFIKGDKGYIYVNSVTNPTKITIVTNTTENAKVYDLSDENGAYVYEVKSFIDAVRYGKKECLEHRPEDSIFIASIMNKIVNP